jgi:Icc-related predicted phosphoesterase
MSDLHLERWKFGDYEQPDCDAIALVGDIGPGFMGLEWINQTFGGGIPVFYVPGNHEFYGEPFNLHSDRLEFRAKEYGVELLQNRAVEHNGVRFIGATLWTDYNLYNTRDQSMIAASQVMSDYKVIDVDDEWFNGQIKPYMVLSEHEYSRKFIIDELNAPFEGKTVILTHHAPSELSVGAEYKGSNHSPYYASRLENLMLDHNIELWCHGHIHSSSDYMVGDTRVIANPRGSERSPNPNFDSKLVIEI